MAKVIIFSRKFPAYHSKAGQETNFVQKFWTSISVPLPVSIAADKLDNEVTKLLLNDYKPKHHTIRSGNRWKVGDKFSPRIWSGKPYQSKQLILADDIEIKQIWDFKVHGSEFKINDRVYGGEVESTFELLEKIAMNDGLDRHDLMEWFKYPKPFSGQIICWSNNVEY